MMNQYTDRMSRPVNRMSRPDGSLPLHRPVSRDNPLPHPGGVGNCGCGLGQAPHRRTPAPQGVPLPVGRDDRSCGCNGGRENSVEGSCHVTKLMQQIQAVDFALYETILYLDVYPHSCDALETYRKLKTQSEALHAEYEAACGPLTAFGNQSTTSWDWMSRPFPWEYDAE